MENQANQGTKLRDWLNVDKTQLSYHLNSATKKNPENTPSTSSVDHQNQLNEIKENKKEELVKYMSNLPSYLEKGDNLREKALSFGVLDWRRLEKWQHNHKQIYSPSSSNNSSYFSTDVSSTYSSQGQSCSPAETNEKEANEVQDLAKKFNKPNKGEHSLFRKYQSFSKSQAGIKLKDCEREDVEPRSKRISKTQNGKSTRQMEGSEGINSDISRNYNERGKNEAQTDDFERNHRRVKQSSSSVNLPSESFELTVHSSKYSISPSRGKNSEDRPIQVSEKSDPKIGTVENYKLRNSSPTRRLSIGLKNIGRRSSSLDLSSEHVQSISKSVKNVGAGSENLKLRNPSPARRFSLGLDRFSRKSSSIDLSDVPQLRFEHDPITSQSKNNVVFPSENATNYEVVNRRSSQFSPLRRLLDPILKPKVVNPDHSVDSSKKDSVKSELQSCEKNKSSRVQALFQMSIKNGLPLFTFADDKNSGVLAATVRKVSTSRKDESRYMYTFFNVDEVKKKSGWMNKGCKGKTHGYVPNLIAQMRVSDLKHNAMDEFGLREFVSFSTNLSETDHKKSNLLPNDELAAIVVKFPKETSWEKEKDNIDQFSERYQYCVNSYDFYNMTVILPSGSHGHPSEGKPSPLIERWKSNGLCDCGGWDLGCRVRVLTSRTEFDRRSNFSKIYRAADIFELIFQGELVEERPVFSLSPFKDSVYSVEFDSSLSFLQAFSICIAFLNCRKPYDLSELSTLFEEKSETTIVADDVIKAPNPPRSPVGRV